MEEGAARRRLLRRLYVPGLTYLTVLVICGCLLPGWDWTLYWLVAVVAIQFGSSMANAWDLLLQVGHDQTTDGEG